MLYLNDQSIKHINKSEFELFKAYNDIMKNIIKFNIKHSKHRKTRLTMESAIAHIEIRQLKNKLNSVTEKMEKEIGK